MPGDIWIINEDDKNLRAITGILAGLFLLQLKNIQWIIIRL